MSLTQHSAHFILRAQDGEVLHEYLLDKPKITIGRASNRDISLPQDKLVSRRHAIVSYEDGNYILHDEGSVNGTSVNGKMIGAMQAYTLQEGDQIRIGKLVFVLQLSEDAQKDVVGKSGQHAASEHEGTIMPALPQEIQDSENIAGSSGFTAPMPAPSSPQLHFTAFYPEEVAAGDWHTLLVYAHVKQATDIIYKDAAAFDEQEEILSSKPDPVIEHLLDGIQIIMVPECQGMVFNPRRITFTWREDWHRIEFRFTAKQASTDSIAHGRISIFAGPLLLATLKLDLLVGEQGDQLKESDSAVTAVPYTQIFPAYSPADTLIVQRCRHIYQALGCHTFIDSDTLRSGQPLSSALKEMIEQAEVFQLFWSAYAAQSPLVTMEYEYALGLLRGEEFIRPVYWDVPLVTPSEPLSSLPFLYLPRYAFLQKRYR